MVEFVRPHYKNAPVVEAVIDIRFVDPDAISVQQLQDAAANLAGTLPNSQPILTFEMELTAQIGGNAQFRNNQNWEGLRLSSPKQDRVLQLKRIGFTYSHLAPYTNWENFRDEAKGYWSTLRSVIPQQIINRIAVRMINKIPVPTSEFEIDDYLEVFPQVPETIPSTVNGMFMNLQLALPNIGRDVRCLLNLAFQNELNAAEPHLLLDIDLFAERVTSSDDEIWSVLEIFGTEKDKLFENCIKDKVREMVR